MADKWDQLAAQAAGNTTTTSEAAVQSTSAATTGDKWDQLAAQAANNNAASTGDGTGSTASRVSDRGRGRASHLRQSMAEGSYTQNLATTPEELAYYNAVSQGYNLDTWHSKAEAESKAASERYSQLKAQLDELKSDAQKDENSQRFARANMLAKILGIGQSGEDKSAELSNLEQAVKQAQAEADKKSEELRYAKQYKDYRDTTRPVEDAAERGVSYKDQYDAYSQTLDRLNKDKEALLKDRSRIKNGAGYYGAAATYEEDKARQEAEEKENSDRLEKLTREIERLEGQRAYAENFLTKDAGAKQIIKQGEELARIAHANKQQNEINALDEHDSDAGFRAAVAFRQAERSGLSPDDRWTQEQKDLYHYYWGAYGQDTAEGFAERVNRYLNGEEAAAGNGVLPGTEIVQQWAERGGKWATAGKALVALAGKLGVNNLVYNAASYIDRMLNVAATGRDAGRSFALPNEIVDAAHSTVANKLNETQIVGGKGLGDLYQLGTSMAQSLVYGNGLGKIGTLGAFFFQAANSSYDEAMQRGASAKYAAAYSTLCGISEGAWETFSFDKLIKGDWTNHFFRTLVTQGFIEGSEEVNTSLFNKYAETIAARLTNEQPMVEREISSLVANGMSRKDAEHQIWTQFAKDVAWDFAGGFISGFGSSAIQSGVNATQNKLWDMRKDAVLGKENAEGQREGGKKNASNDELSKMFDRALKRGDIRGAEQILQVIEQRGATAEEQEYGPADPTANERMRKRLERQLNGERVNPQTENAEIVEESATNRQLAEEARVQAEFPTISPITMELVRRLYGKDFVTMAKSMTTQELAEVARYARYIGEEAKANLLEQIRLDPTYRYEEQTPAHTDEDDLLQNGPQNVAGQQVAPAGQITQPIQQNTAQTVKPNDSATAENRLFNVAQNPNGVSTTSTESGTMSVPNTQEVTTNAGEQAAQQSEAAEAADFGVGRRPAGAGAATGQRGVAQETTASEQGAQSRTERSAEKNYPRFVTEEDLATLSDTEESSPISAEQKEEYKQFEPLLNDGTYIVSKPRIGTRLHLAMKLAKKLKLNMLFGRNANTSVYKDGASGYQNGNQAVIDADTTLMEVPTAVAHEAGHIRYNGKFGGFSNIVNGAFSNRLGLFTNIFNNALGEARGKEVMSVAEKFVREEKGYENKYQQSRNKLISRTNEMLVKSGKFLSQDSKKLVSEMEQARAIEEFLNQVLASDYTFLDGIQRKTDITWDEIYDIRDSLCKELVSAEIFNDGEISAIDDAITALDEEKFAEDYDDEFNAADFVNGRWYQSKNVGLNKTLKTILNGDTKAVRALSDEDLFGAMKYILDKGLSSGQNGRISEGQAISNLFLGVDSREANKSTAWTYEKGYQGGTFRGMNQQQKNDMFTAAERIITELAERGYSITSLSDFSKYANRFGIHTDKNGNVIDLSYQPKSEENTDKNAGVISMQEEDAREAEYDRRHKASDLYALKKAADIQKSGMSWREAPRSMKRGANYVKEAVPTKPEDHGWIKPVEVSEKEVKRAREAVETKKKVKDYKEKKALLQAHLDYYAAVVDAMRNARSATYDQKVADLGYLADNIKEELEWLDEDMANVARGVIGIEEEAVIDDIAIEKGNLNVQLDALRDEYKHLDKEDQASYQAIRKQIDAVLSQINVLNLRINKLSKIAERADWGSNKRTLFQAEMAENPNGLTQERDLPEQNREEPLSDTGWPQSAVNRASGKTFVSEFDTEPVRRTMSEDPIAHMSTKELDDYLKRMRSVDNEFNAADFGEPERGMGTGYRGMQRSRNKDGSLEFRTMYDDAPPARPATDKPRKPLNQPSTAYGNVAQAARSILNAKNSFFDFSEKRPKDIPNKVTNAMGQLYSHVREMMEGDHPVNALMQLSNLVHEFANDEDLKMFTSESIQHAVDELNDIYYNQDITNEEKAQRMVENATKTLTLISKRAQLVDRSYTMLKAFKGPRKKRDSTTYWSKFKAMQLNPSTLFKAMDGFARDKNGSGYQIAKMIENGTALYTITQAQALKKLSDVSGLEGFKEFAEGNAKPFDIDGVKITEQQAVEFIMQVRNLQNTNVTGKDGPTTRLNTIDGFSIKDKDGNNTFIERSDDADGTNAEWFLNLAEAMENSLSPAAKKYLETATEILDDLGQQASDIRTNLIGTGFDNSINGTYYPINYDNKNGTAESQQNKPTSLFSGPMYQSRTRNVGGYVSIKNASDTMDRYIHWASNAIGYGEVAELLYAMDNTGSRMQNLSSLANDTLGQGYSEYIAKYIKDINEIPDGQKNDKSAFAVLRRNMAAGALLGNLGVAAKQAASLWSAAGVLSPQALLSAETYFGGHSGAGNMILQSRMTGTSLDPTISEILHNDSFMGKLMKRSGVSEAMGKATAFVDYQTVKRLFAATVVDTKLSFPGLDQNSELFAQTVEAKFQDVVLQTQPIFVKNARAGYLRSNDELTKAFAMFRTQPTQNLNSIVTAMGEYRALKGTEFGKAAGKKLRNTIIGQTASAVTFATLSAIVRFARHGLKKFRDDDDEILWAEVAKRIGLDSLESLAGISVVGGDIAKAIIDMATGGDTKEFYDMNAGVLTMLFDTVSSVTTFGTNVVKAIKDDKPLAVFNAGRQAADNLLQLGGIPANTVYRLLNTMTMYSADALRALSGGKLGNRAEYDDALKMLDSYIKGDLTEEGAKTQAAKAFRKDQPENLLYNLGILSSLTEEDGQDKGRNYLDSLIKKSGDSDDEESKNHRIVDYLVHQSVSADKIDKAVDQYGTSYQYNQFYDILRQNGHSPIQAVKKLDEIDTNGDSKITTDELQNYWKKHGHEPKENKLVEALFGPTADDFRIIKDTKTYETATRYYKPVVDSGVTAEKAVEIVDGCRSESGDVTQAGIYQYYLAHPEDIKQIQALYNSMGYKENGKPRTWESFLKYQAKQAAKKAS